MKNWNGVILAAGKGTRMNSHLPKVLHPVCGSPMVRLVIEALHGAGFDHPLVVIPPQSKEFGKALERLPHIPVEQPERRGTGDALAQALSHPEASVDHVLVVNGDVPLIRPDSIKKLIATHTSNAADITFMTSLASPSSKLGRVVRDETGAVARIVEASEGDEDNDTLSEINVGVYCFQVGWTRQHLTAIEPSRNQEVYLTTLIELAYRNGGTISTMPLKDPLEGIGINNRLELAQAEEALRQRLREYWMFEGVTMIDPSNTYIDWDVSLGRDTILHPNTVLTGKTSIGTDCEIGPGSVIRDSTLGNRCRIQSSFLEQAVLKDDVEVGPFSHLRPESYIDNGVHIGNFAEVKQSWVGQGTRMGHFSYIGDAIIGNNVNIGAGTITCNFDGVLKHQTIVEEGVFLGSDTLLIAPVRVGARSSTGAGSVVTKDVLPDTTVVGSPARAVKKRLP